MKAYPTPVTCLLIFSWFTAFSQEKVDTAIMRKIRTEAMTHSHVREIAHHLTEVAGPRLTNSPGYKRASTWAVTTMKQWGLVNVATEPFGEYGKAWELEKFYLAVKSPYYQPVIGYPFAYTSSTNGLISAPVIVINESDTSAVRRNKDQIKNKIVMLTSGDSVIKASPFKAYATRYTDSTLSKLGDLYMTSREELGPTLAYFKNRRKLAKQVRDAGAVAIFRRSSGRDGTVVVDGLYEFKRSQQPGLPEIILAAEDFLKIMRMTKTTGKVEMELEVRTKFLTNDLTGYNVVAEIAGTDPALKTEVVMLGAHLDSWHSGTGATDNAAGCTVMMEAVRILKALNIQPRRTIRIALWGGEEQALLGSYGYVKRHFGDASTMQLKTDQSKVSAYYNLDNGTGKIRGVFLQHNEAARSLFQRWLDPFADLGASTITSSNAGGTDHLSFDAVGIPGFQFIQDPIEYMTRTHHSNMDTYDHLLFDDLQQASIIVAAFVYNTAMSNEKLPRKPLPKAGEWLLDIDLFAE